MAEHSNDLANGAEPVLTLLVVEDDADLAGALVAAFAAQGWRAQHAASIQAARDVLAKQGFDCVVLDRGLPMQDGQAPSADGLSLVDAIRAAHSRTSVMILSAIGDQVQKIRGLDSGADDYLVKPFDELELIARVRAMRRRIGVEGPALDFHGLTLKLNERIALINGVRLDLGAKEFALLAYLGERRPEVITKAMLIRDVWKLNFDPGTNVVEVTIKRLRDRLQAAGAPAIIETIKGQPMQQRPGGWRVIP